MDFIQPIVVAPAVLGDPVSTEQNSDKMVEMLDMKVQRADLKVDIANLKLEIKDLKNGELGKPFDIGDALVALVMLNLFVTILVATIWK